jgi:uncharacterized protein YjiS (DUF1127 family)
MLCKRISLSFRRWRMAIQARSELSGLSDHTLSDIGLNRSDVIAALDGFSLAEDRHE